MAGIDEALGDAVQRDGSLVGKASPAKRLAEDPMENPDAMSWHWKGDPAVRDARETGLDKTFPTQGEARRGSASVFPICSRPGSAP